jgi:hypothetical protein
VRKRGAHRLGAVEVALKLRAEMRLEKLCDELLKSQTRVEKPNPPCGVNIGLAEDKRAVKATAERVMRLLWAVQDLFTVAPLFKPCMHGLKTLATNSKKGLARQEEA